MPHPQPPVDVPENPVCAKRGQATEPATGQCIPDRPAQQAEANGKDGQVKPGQVPSELASVGQASASTAKPVQVKCKHSLDSPVQAQARAGPVQAQARAGHVSASRTLNQKDGMPVGVSGSPSAKRNAFRSASTTSGGP